MSKPNQKYRINPAFQAVVHIDSRQRGMMPSKLEIPLDRDLLKLLGTLVNLGEQYPGAKNFPRQILRNLDLLLEMGALVPAELAPREVEPKWTFSKQQLKWVPNVFRAEWAQIKSKLTYNSTLVKLPHEIDRSNLGQLGIPPQKTFPVSKTLFWVLDPGTRIWAPYQGTKSTLKLLKDLASGCKRPEQLDDEWRELLWHARVLTHHKYCQERDAYWRSQGSAMRKSLLNERYVVLRRILSPMQIAILRKYFRDLEQEGYLNLDLDQVIQKRYFRHNDPMLEFVHRQSGPLVRQVCAMPILPSYSYLSAYLHGADLKRHRDRPQCAWNCSLLIDQNPEVSISKSWPMYVETLKGVKEIRLDFGDAVFYSGTELYHWRESIGDRHRQTLGLLHYVPIDFVGSLG